MENVIIPKPGTIYSDQFAEGSDGNYYRKVSGVWTLIEMGEGMNITNIDCSENPLCPVIKENQMLRVTADGLFGGENGPEVETDDLIICVQDNDEASPWEEVSEKFFILQADIQPTNLRELIRNTVFSDGIKIFDSETERVTLKKVGEGGEAKFIVEIFDKTKQATAYLIIQGPINSNKIELYADIDEQEIKLVEIAAGRDIGEEQIDHIKFTDERGSITSLLARVIVTDGTIRTITVGMDGFTIVNLEGIPQPLKIGETFKMVNADDDVIEDFAGRISFNGEQVPMISHGNLRSFDSILSQKAVITKLTSAQNKHSARLWSGVVTPESIELMSRYLFTTDGIMPGQDEINGVIFEIRKYLPDYAGDISSSAMRIDIINAMNLPVKYRFLRNGLIVPIYDYAGTLIGDDITLAGNVGSTIKAIIVRDIVETEPEVFVEVTKIVLLPCKEMEIYQPN
jgi:hypothetical protein